MTDEEWEALKLALPIGEDVQGRVTVHARFGIFLRLDNYPTVNAVVLAPDFERSPAEGQGLDEYPPVGSLVQAEVLDHVDLTKQIRLHVGPYHRIEVGE